jgi:hypothetical protein
MKDDANLDTIKILVVVFMYITMMFAIVIAGIVF